MKVIAVIATRDRFELLKKAFHSVINQTRKVDKFIIVSDSINDTFIKEQEYMKNYECTLVRNVYSHNYAGNLNSCLKYICNLDIDYDDTYIAFLDDDDTWDNCYIEECLNKSNKADFVVTGLKYENELGLHNLDIPSSLNIQSFLKGNPGIQGSNTFIRLSTLLEAGCFDENLSSTTDRDLFTRVMMLNPTYTILNEYLVNVDAYNSRPRITNSNNIKVDGLSKFYYKYSNFMSAETIELFFKRAQERFNASKETILQLIDYSNCDISMYEKYNIDSIHSKLIMRKRLIDTIYANNKTCMLSKRAFLDLEQKGFNIFESGHLLETPIYNANESLYKSLSNKGLSKLDSKYNNIYKEIIAPLFNSGDAKEWLMDLISNITTDKVGKDIIYRCVIETINNVKTPLKYNSFVVLYYDYIDEIISKLIFNEYRICGLNKILKQEYDCNAFVNKLRNIKNEITCEYKVRGLFDYLKHMINKGKVLKAFLENKNDICNFLKLDVNSIRILGNGAEGCVFTDEKKIYKWYLEKETMPNSVILNNLVKVKKLTLGCPLFYDFEILQGYQSIIISYDYHKSRKLTDSDKDDLLKYIQKLKQYNLSLDNVKLENFIVDETGIKFIDFGPSISQYDELITQKGLDRIDVIFDICRSNSINYYFYYNKYYYDLTHNPKGVKL